LRFGLIGNRFGPLEGIYLALLVRTVVTHRGTRMDSVEDSYQPAFVIGQAQGGIQALGQSFYTRVIPEGHTAEYFAFYNMMGKFAADSGSANERCCRDYKRQSTYRHPVLAGIVRRARRADCQSEPGPVPSRLMAG
jgi:hypothetical protein